jgi:hypothetical protein
MARSFQTQVLIHQRYVVRMNVLHEYPVSLQYPKDRLCSRPVFAELLLFDGLPIRHDFFGEVERSIEIRPGEIEHEWANNNGYLNNTMNTKSKLFADDQTMAVGVFLNSLQKFSSAHGHDQLEKPGPLRRRPNAIDRQRPGLADFPTWSQFPYLAKPDRPSSHRSRNCRLGRWPRKTLERQVGGRNQFGAKRNRPLPLPERQWVHGRITVGLPWSGSVEKIARVGEKYIVGGITKSLNSPLRGSWARTIPTGRDQEGHLAVTLVARPGYQNPGLLSWPKIATRGAWRSDGVFVLS